MEVTSALPAAGGVERRRRGGVTWFSEGIYNKVALTVELKTFTQVYISTSATAIETRHATKHRAASLFAFLDVGHRLKREGGKQTFSQVILIHEIILALPALWVSPLPHPPSGTPGRCNEIYSVSFISIIKLSSRGYLRNYYHLLNICLVKRRIEACFRLVECVRISFKSQLYQKNVSVCCNWALLAV